MEKAIFLILVVGAIAVFASPAYSHAQDSRWKYYSTDGAHNDHYYDMKSVVRAKDHTIRVWEKKVATEDSDEVMKAIKEFKELKEINCVLREYRSHVNYWFEKEDKWQRKPTEWQPIEPETWMEALRDVVCGKNNKR
jgi:hypothetical protein